ncbi:5'-nucleotidase C-terminal domain-containing protein [Sphingobacterium psychroaquaticum]|uniref:5'-nucleotidase, C-terminal domain n=1 Tax=Sphingobacterium psychroaquaticum TaxID=561061 RepID=A0A1X7ILI7_9SPHI|nr:5'-nucleotidase [Sphingobacterium psychroaquaticum]SMG15173.1 5'-nucleotidase, C-terminal domain [Sphingobacterium psychroaquaticum]
MGSSIRWASFLVSAALLVSCKTQLQPTVNKVQYYQIDANYSIDSAIVKYYSPYKIQLESEMNRVIGFSDAHLTKTREAESLAANFFTDALLWKGQQLDPAVQVSFATKGGIRSDLKAGNITVGNIFEIMPFENSVTVLTLSGKDMLRWADYMARTGGQPASGIKLLIENKKVKEFLVQGKPIDPNQTYKLVTYDYLANGGDYVDFLDQVLDRKDYTQRIRESLMEYVSELTKQGKHIQATIDGRVRIIE